MAKRYGLTVITLQAHGKRVQWLPQLGTETKQGAAHYRTGLRHGFAGFSTISPTRKYVKDYERGYKEGSNVADKAGLGASYVPPEVKQAQELVAQHKFALAQGDDVHTQNVEGDVMDYGDKLMRQVSGMAEFAAVAKGEYSAFRREMKNSDTPQAKALTVLFNYCDEVRAEDVCRFVKYVPMPTDPVGAAKVAGKSLEAAARFVISEIGGGGQPSEDTVLKWKGVLEAALHASTGEAPKHERSPSYVDFRVGLHVRVVNKKYGEAPVVEGMATIKKIHQGDKGGVHAVVEFDNKPGDLVERWVFAQYQDAELEYVV